MTRTTRGLKPVPAATADRLRPAARLLALAAALALPMGAAAQARPADAPEAAAAPAPVDPPSALDAPMFYQLMAAEFEAQAGRYGNAHEIMLDAARRLRDSQLFERAVELAVQARAGDKALAATKAWRQALPQSVEAARAQVQVLVALGRTAELGEPLRMLLALSPEAERAALITSLPRFLESSTDKAAAFKAADQALDDYLDAPATRLSARVALGRIALANGQPERALQLARRALADDPNAWPPVLLALELSPTLPGAEGLVQASLGRADAPPALRLAYARTLEQRFRLVEAIDQLQRALAQDADLPQGWLSLGAMQLDLRETAAAETALNKALAHLPPSSDGEDPARREQLLDFIHQLLAQAAEQRGDDRAVLDWLGRIPDARADLPVQSRRAGVLARQGRLDEARRLLREGAIADSPEPRARLLAEAQLLRSVRRWQEAYDLLLQGVRQAPDDSGLIYELAMVAEQLQRFDDMEVLLKRVTTLKPDDAHAFNALGYSLVERNVRLDEAAPLIRRAVELAPNDPFIADSLGWLAYRQGQLDEAERVLRKAWGSRPHPEVAAHLGEVLWAQGKHAEARALWDDGLRRERDNEALIETVARLTGAKR